MSTDLTRTSAASSPVRPSSRTVRVATGAAAVAGIAFVGDTLAILALDRNFGVADNLLFFIGLAAMLVFLVAAALRLTRRRRPRALWVAGAAVLVLGLLGLLPLVGQAAADRWYHGDRLALQDEWSFFLFGVELLVLAFVVRRRGR